MKLCSRCNEIKPLDEFNKRSTAKDKKQPFCRSCSSLLFKKYYNDNKDYHNLVVKNSKRKTAVQNVKLILEYFKTHPCIDCNEKNPIVLDFDHNDRNEKTDNVSNMLVNNSSWETIWGEIQKCSVRCANCHRIKTARENGNLRYKLINDLL